jgi:hypothetical protein
VFWNVVNVVVLRKDFVWPGSLVKLRAIVGLRVGLVETRQSLRLPLLAVRVHVGVGQDLAQVIVVFGLHGLQIVHEVVVRHVWFGGKVVAVVLFNKVLHQAPLLVHKHRVVALNFHVFVFLRHAQCILNERALLLHL